jgi:hypothetical protein
MNGKYSSLRDSALHYLCTNGWDNGEFGDVQDYGVYVWRISNTPEEVALVNTEFTSVIEDWFKENPEAEDDSIFRADLVGHFIVWESSQGFVSVIHFDTEEELEEKYNHFLKHYGEWVEESEQDL